LLIPAWRVFHGIHSDIMSAIRLIVGLGNPGREYETTRITPVIAVDDSTLAKFELQERGQVSRFDGARQLQARVVARRRRL
jgi:peptidyl-tRNA hydrolase